MMQAVGLRTHIWNNNLRSALLLAGFPVLLIGIVFALQLGAIGAGFLPSSGSVSGDLAMAFGWLAASAPGALVVAGVWFVVAYFANTAIISLATGAKDVTRAEAPQLYNLLENLCISRGIKTPRLQIIEQPAMNAFASGLNEKQYTITVTRGLLDAMTPAELEAVLAHELTHVMNRDVRTMVIAAVFAGIISLICQMIFRSLRWGLIGRRSGGSRKGGGGAAIVFILIAVAAAALGYVLALVIRMALSRSREFVADAGSVELTKNPDAMISALQKIDGGEPLPSPEAVQAMFLENKESGVFSLFATHPPISKRIAALEQYAGGRVVEAAPAVAPTATVDAEAGPWGEHTPGEKGPWG